MRIEIISECDYCGTKQCSEEICKNLWAHSHPTLVCPKCCCDESVKEGGKN